MKIAAIGSTSPTGPSYDRSYETPRLRPNGCGGIRLILSSGRICDGQ